METTSSGNLLWILPIEGLVVTWLTVMILARFIRRVPVPRPATYRIAAAVGFAGYVVYLLSSGSYSLRPRLPAVAIGILTFLAAIVLPIEAGFVGWMGTKSRARWAILATGFLLALAPYLIPCVIAMFR